jgi:hypothetical protein
VSKYAPLKDHLGAQWATEVPMNFVEIEKVIGDTLPPSAYKHRAWWSNNPSNSVITYAWLEAGYETERVDMSSRKLVFRRVSPRPPRPPSTPSQPPPNSNSAGAIDDGGILGRLRAALGGTVRVAEGVDLTDPTGEIWDAEIQ